MSQNQIILVLTLTLALSACGKKAVETTSSDLDLFSVDQTESVVESGITALNGVADEQANSALTSFTKPQNLNKYELFKSVFIQEAFAAVCSRAYQQSCVNGIKTISYSGCTNSNAAATFNGDVSLTYSHGSCTLAVSGDSVTRTYDLNIAGPRGGIMSVTSDNAVDYLGSSYGGGGKLSKTNSGFEIEIMGKHKSLSYNGRTRYSVSMRTTSPVQITGTIARAGRTVSGGALEINHNLAKFTTSITPNNLNYSNVCCHPVSGTLAINYSGSITGSATLTFNGCGSATYVKAGQSKDITLSYCE